MIEDSLYYGHNRFTTSTNQPKTKQSLQTELTLLSLGLHEEVSHGFRSRAFLLSRSAWKALVWWVMKGCRPSLSKTRHTPAFTQFLYPPSLRRAASSSRTMSALFPDRRHNKEAEQVQSPHVWLHPPCTNKRAATRWRRLL